MGNSLLAGIGRTKDTSQSPLEHGKHVSGHGSDLSPRQGPTTKHLSNQECHAMSFREAARPHRTETFPDLSTETDRWPRELTSIYDQSICECRNSCIWKYIWRTHTYIGAVITEFSPEKYTNLIGSRRSRGEPEPGLLGETLWQDYECRDGVLEFHRNNLRAWFYFLCGTGTYNVLYTWKYFDVILVKIQNNHQYVS